MSSGEGGLNMIKAGHEIPFLNPFEAKFEHPRNRHNLRIDIQYCNFSDFCKKRRRMGMELCRRDSLSPVRGVFQSISLKPAGQGTLRQKSRPAALFTYYLRMKLRATLMNVT